ncbi:MAG: hypothetical protein FWC78_01395 [Defluviitaleaceae bacterium]|nr:hypothetical protein [Defluviitaleaceae bacterium]
MKKILIFAMLLVMGATFAACSNGAEETTAVVDPTPVAQPSPAVEPTVETVATTAEPTAEPTQEPTAEPTPAATPTPDATATPDAVPAAGLTAFEMYQHAFAMLDEVDSMAFNTIVWMFMDIMGEEIEITMEMEISMEMLSPTELLMQMDSVMDMGILGQTSYSTFFRDGYMYMTGESMDLPREEGIRMPLPLEEVLSMVGSDFNTFTMDMIQDYIVTPIDGGYEIEFTVVGFDDMLNEMLDMMGALIGDLSDDAFEIEIGETLFGMFVDADGALVDMGMLMDMTMTIEGETVFMEMISFTEYLQLGGVTVTFPAYIDGFTDMGDLF